MSRDIGAYMYEQLGRVAPIVEVPLAWHHIMLDQPIPLVTGCARCSPTGSTRRHTVGTEPADTGPE